MKKVLFTLLLLSGLSKGQERPKLVVGLVVDQMKMEYLYRFSNDFSANGFKRLQSDGFTFHNVHYNYIPTYTGPGHASIYTGTTPSVHGIVGNEWFNKAIGKDVYCTDDVLERTLGNGSKSEGEMSPRNLQSTTITDELKLATKFEGKVIGMSLKDRGAILPAGHFANWAFWYSSTGSFISSTYYGKELPTWLTQFNEQKHYLKYLNKGWDLLKDKSVYNESLNDNSPYEGKMFQKEPFLPYNLKDMYDNNDAGVLKSTPYGNSILADLAKAAIDGEALGQDEVTDFLTVSFSATDYIGHKLGPRAIELQDTYLRLDETIADFLDFLDKKVGKGNYLVFLTADHAGAENVSYLKDNKYKVEAISYNEIKKDLKAFSEEAFGDNIILDYSNFNVFLDHSKIEENDLKLNDVKAKLVQFLYTKDYVKRVYTEEQVMANSGTDIYLNSIANGYDPTQNGELIVLEKPGYIEYSTTGTTHGTPYTYDTYVPLLFYGWNIKQGESFNRKDITQIAPTLALKLKTTLPNGTNADVLEEVLDK